MVSARPQAGSLQRTLAVCVDFLVFVAIWALIRGERPLVSALAVYLIADVILTAYFGVSVGRLVFGVRVVRRDGRRAGLAAAAIRTAIVFATGWAGVWVFAGSARTYDAPPTTMWWDVAAKTMVVRTKTAQPVLEPRARALRGFGLTEADIAANEGGRLSGRQRRRLFIRAFVYAAGAVLCVGVVFFSVATASGFDGRLVVVLLFAVLYAGIGAWASGDLWRDAVGGRVVQIEGVPRKELEREPSRDGTWEFPYLRLHGEHKLSWNAFRAVDAGRRYRLYVVPHSGRCVAAVPLEMGQVPAARLELATS